MADAQCWIDALEAACKTLTVGQLVSTQARTYGSVTAIDIFDRNERATYSEMDRWSNKYAHALCSFGVRKGDRIGVMLPNHIQFPLLWFALAKLGAVLVPVNMRYTHREIEYVLSDTQAKFAIVDESAWPVFSAMDPWPRNLAKGQTIVVGTSAKFAATTLDDLLKGIQDSPVDKDVRPDDLLNVAYTCGTTGFPKGCMLTHDYWGVGSYGSSATQYQPCTRFLSWSPFFYGETQGQLLRSYRQGGTLYLAPQMSSSQFIGWLKRYHIEWCAFLEFVTRQPAADDASTCVKLIRCCSGWSRGSIERFRGRFGARGQNMYGTMEIGWCTIVPADFDHVDQCGSIGMRAPFRALRLVSDDGTPTPVGEVGELWASGRGMFKGYWNRPEANAESFSGEWFKTGDMMRRDEFGFYWLVGRTKDVIRRSGENIAAREVEAVIREIAEIEDVAAVPVRDAKRGEEVKVYVQLKEGRSPKDSPAERILEHARARLAVFKVPRYVAFIEALPRRRPATKF
ncbi:acyl-CoA synthetase (AMP-forming)/AMP-acid ligase II [Bradyrhizobium sp. CIR18]|uniref:class I adenylate-forming enzyme family protein n=1 Tax=Bradyrhizobium sp. CIR18 TaxID=2663839 RepID=UPI00185B08CB|nr:class I adenylate-forming enzyme family protein [Bradyrhizobium sp. CIR18]MBB4365250.1 acyl-CoA synthetase (AMP-forming)/AMP-acid ligase II [Bradyrhizobium sp. CIR18]